MQDVGLREAGSWDQGVEQRLSGGLMTRDDLSGPVKAGALEAAVPPPLNAMVWSRKLHRSILSRRLSATSLCCRVSPGTRGARTGREVWISEGPTGPQTLELHTSAVWPHSTAEVGVTPSYR